MQKTTTTLTPLALKDAPALIETVFPAQKVSFEAQKERKAQASQTLTALGSFWKGRKPLILVRAVVLGALLPATDDPEQDLDVFERLMAFDEESLARRALTNYAKHAKVRGGIHITDPKHNIYGIADKKVPDEVWWTDANGKKTKLRGKWDYKYESTAGLGGTIFWKYNADFVKASGNKEYN